MKFKYQTLLTFFDADAIACVFVNEVLELFPKIDEFTISYPIGDGKFMGRDFHSFTWDIGETMVMASSDLEYFITIYRRTVERCEKENIDLDDLDLSIICICSVCDELLFPDDEAYIDENTGEVLCDKHSVCNDDTGNYVKITDDTLIEDDDIFTDNIDHLWFKHIGGELVEVYYASLYLGEVRMWFDSQQCDREYLAINHTVSYIDEMGDKFIRE